MADEPNFLDLASLSKITPDLVVEKFGSKINSSFFDGSNILGTLRLKGLIDFTANFPGQSVITVTDIGKQLLKEAADRATMPFDTIDLAILQQLQAGKRSYIDIGNAVNLRPRDLAMHLYKLSQQQYTVYEIKNGVLDIMLTDKGLTQAKGGMPQTEQQNAEQQKQAAAAPQQQAPQPMKQVTPTAQQTGAEEAQAAPPGGMSIDDIEKQIKREKRSRTMKIIVIAVVVIIIVVVALSFTGFIRI